MTKTTKYGQVAKQTNLTSASLLIEGENIAQAADEFSKRLKVCAEVPGQIRLTFTINA